LNWEAKFPWTNGPSGWPIASPEGAFGCVLGGQATKSTVLVRPKDLFCVNFELGGQISLDQWNFMLAFTMGDFGCVLGDQATKSTVCVRPKDIFCVNFGQEEHLPT
jgi:hypothetical protein